MRYAHKRTKSNKPHFSVRILQAAAVIGCLTIVSAYLLSGVYAKFSVTASGSESAKVAKFNVTVSEFQGQETAELTVTNTTAVYTFKVASDSEVAVGYDIILELPADAGVPGGVSFTLDGKAASVSGNTYTFSDSSWSFAAGKGERQHTLQVKVSLFEQSSMLEGIAIKVVARQLG